MAIDWDKRACQSAFAAGNRFWRQGLVNEAMVAYRQAIRAAPLFVAAYDNLASLHRRQGELAAKALVLELASSIEQTENLLKRLTSQDPPDSSALQTKLELIKSSGLFDSDWYLAQHPIVKVLQQDPAEHWLRCGICLGWNPSGHFDSRFYVECHNEVEQMGLNPLLHYLAAGRMQGLATTPAVFDAKLRRSTSQLWGPHRQQAEKELRDLLADPATPIESRLVGAQHLAAALGWWGRWTEAEAKWRAMPDSRAKQLGLALLVPHQQRQPHNISDTAEWLAWANSQESHEKLAVLNCLWRKQGLAAIGLNVHTEPASIDNLASSAPMCRRDWGLVSVIVPVRNCEQTLGTALASICSQSYQNLEVLVVDDASDDSTAAVASQWVRRDGRVKLLRQKQRGGTYRARNKALSMCHGSYITCHDGDDWSHPQKLEWQLKALQRRPERWATMSRWARCSDQLVFSAGWRIWPRLLHDNLSSLMLRRSVIERLGGWDPVVVGADAEYQRRMKALGGEAAIAVVEPDTPLSLGRLGKDTLTSASATHVSSTLHGLRHSYKEITRLWQQRHGGLERANQLQRLKLLPPECFGRTTSTAGVVEQCVVEGDCSDPIWLAEQARLGHWRWLRHRPGTQCVPVNPGEPLGLHPLCLELLEKRGGCLLI